MSREESIGHIEALFPPDSEYPDTAAVGERLLKQAQSEVAGWRTLPTEVLERFARLCVAEDNRAVRSKEQ